MPSSPDQPEDEPKKAFVLPKQNGTSIPALPNQVWDFAHAIQHCTTPADEGCTLLQKTIPSSGGNHLKLKSYHPSVFAQIRAQGGLTEEDFKDEWDADSIAEKVAAKGAGKSGSLFVPSKSGKLLLKTLRQEEKNTLRKMASSLLDHFVSYPGSLLSRQYALCRVSTKGVKLYFVVFNNLFVGKNIPDAKIYDLKGSKVNRKSKAADLAKPGHVRMDMDYPRQFPINHDLRESILEQINADSDLLAKFNIMDYSLLVGVFKTETTEHDELKVKKKRKGSKKKSKLETIDDNTAAEPAALPVMEDIWRLGLPSSSTDSQEHFMIGIIDILQEYNTFKKSAHAIKVVLFCTIAGLSTVPADYYADRFKRYMESNVLEG